MFTTQNGTSDTPTRTEQFFALAKRAGKVTYDHQTQIKAMAGTVVPSVWANLSLSPWTAVPITLGSAAASVIAYRSAKKQKSEWEEEAKRPYAPVQKKNVPDFFGTYAFSLVIGAGILEALSGGFWIRDQWAGDMDKAKQLVQSACWTPQTVIATGDQKFVLTIDSIHNVTETTDNRGSTTIKSRVEETITAPREQDASAPAAANVTKQYHWAAATASWPVWGFLEKGQHLDKNKIESDIRVNLWDPKSPTYQTTYRDQVVTLKCVPN